jgi:Ca2+/Na+ antiporter
MCSGPAGIPLCLVVSIIKQILIHKQKSKKMKTLNLFLAGLSMIGTGIMFFNLKTDAHVIMLLLLMCMSVMFLLFAELEAKDEKIKQLEEIITKYIKS